MCDDGSTDDTYKVAQSFAQKFPDKIIVIQNDKNEGLNYTLNHCLCYAKGDFIARMDGDDLCSPLRFEKEIKVLLDNPDISIVSTAMEYFDDDGVFGRCHVNKEPHNIDFVFSTPFCHAPCMVRKEAYDDVSGYSVDNWLMRVEDYHLWIKMYAKGYKGVNIDEVLYSMRDDRNAYKRRKFKYRLNEAYVKLLAVKMLNIPKKYLVFALKPIIVGLLPVCIYNLLHKQKIN